MSTSFLIYNPVAGRLQRNPRLVPTTLDALRSAGIDAEPLPTAGPGGGLALARECAAKGAKLVVVLGGDGTVNEVVNGLAKTQTALAVLPGGTANCLAVELGLGTNPLRAARSAGSWQPHRIGLGLAEATGREPRYFTVMAGAGFDAQVVRQVDPLLKRMLGKGAYWAAGFMSVFRRLPELEVRNGKNYAKVSFALASRVRNYGGDLEIAKTIRITDPKFETVLFEGQFAYRYLKYLSGVLLDQHRGMDGVHVTLTDDLDLRPSSNETIYLQLDGEQYGQLPARLRIVPDALTLMAPPWTR